MVVSSQETVAWKQWLRGLIVVSSQEIVAWKECLVGTYFATSKRQLMIIGKILTPVSCLLSTVYCLLTPTEAHLRIKDGSHLRANGIRYTRRCIQMSNPFKKLFKLDQKIFLAVIGLELLKTLFVPNPIDVLILVGLIIVFVGCYIDDFPFWAGRARCGT